MTFGGNPRNFKPSDSIRPVEPELDVHDTVFSIILIRSNLHDDNKLDMDFISDDDDDDYVRYYKCGCGCGCDRSYAHATSSYCRGCREGMCPEYD
jgi:hypothetical protein